MDKLLRGLSHELHLGAVRNCCQEYADRARREGWTYERFLCELLQAENEQRAENAQKKRLKTAGFPQYKYMEELDMEELPEGARLLADELKTLKFVREGRSAVFYGNPGTGKTHLSIALGILACRERMTVMFTSVPHLITQIKECRSQQTLHALETRFRDQIQALRPRHLRRIRVHGLRQGGRRTALQPPLAQGRDEVHHRYDKPLL